jgi:lysyl endopeptidase
MRLRSFMLRAASLALAALLPLASAANVQRATGEAAWADAASAKRASLDPFVAKDAALATLDFAAPAAHETTEIYAHNKAALTARGKRVQVGFGRDVNLAVGSADSRTWQWQALGDGRMAARIAITSPGASGLRVGLMADFWPQGVEIRAQGSEADDILNQSPTRIVPAAGTTPTETLWSPALPGATQWVEIVWPHDIGATLRVVQISHLLAHPLAAGVPVSKLDRDIGSGGRCNSDVACVSSPSQALRDTFASVAKMVFTDAGRSFRCTGTLLNDTDTTTQTPWFITGNHCFDNAVLNDSGNPIAGARNKTPAEMDVVARTLNTYWNFQSTTCGAVTSPNTQLRAGGSSFVTNNDALDMLFLRLAEAPPTGSFFSGWDAAAVTANMLVTGIHHPGGDLKKISQGGVVPTVFRTISISTSLRTGSFSEVVWTQGVTEQGSSGSGIFNRPTANEPYFFRGGLWGGISSCSATSEPDFYSRMDQYFSQLSQFLAPGQPQPVTAQNGWWWNRNESGRGFFIERRGNNVFMAGYYYEPDGRNTWFVAFGPITGTSYSANMLGVRGGQTLTGAYRSPQPATSLGTVQIEFTSATTATMRWPGGTTALERFSFGGAGTGVPENGWWWNPAEDGRGFSIEIQGNTMFMVGYMYDDASNPVWYITSGSLTNIATYQGQWQLVANGQALNAPYRAPIVLNPNIGNITVSFVSTRSANLTLPNGRIIPLTRFDF